MNGDLMRLVFVALGAMTLTAAALQAVLLMVDLFGKWGFWVPMSAAVVFPPWLRLRARVS